MAENIDSKIPISWLHTQGYCEYQIQLEYVQKIKSKPTKAMQLGKKIHEKLEEDHKEKADLKLSTEGALSKVKEEKVTLICRELPIEGTNIYGIIDEVQLNPDQIRIIDDKPGQIAYISMKKQVWGYCLAFQEKFNPDQAIIACLRNRDTQEVIWEKNFSTEDNELVQKAIDRIMGILNQTKEAIPTGNPNKCQKCRFQTQCTRKTLV